MSIAVLVGVLPALETLVLGSLAPSTSTDHPAPKKTVLGAQYRGDSVRVSLKEYLASAADTKKL